LKLRKYKIKNNIYKNVIHLKLTSFRGTSSTNIAKPMLRADTASLDKNSIKSPTELIAATLNAFSTMIENAF
jgi:hypothetical protein